MSFKNQETRGVVAEVLQALDLCNMRDKRQKKTSIGGQAVIEGVMMRGKTAMATAVRDGEGVIRIESERLKNQSNGINKIPVLRGAVSFFSSLVIGVKILTRSAEVYGEEDSEPSKFEKWLSKTFKVDVMSVVIFFGVVLGLAFSIGLFFILPHFLGNLFEETVTPVVVWRNIFEGILRIAIFIGYILLTSLIKDVKRTYMYHGAEHKTITCYEKGLPLTVENVRGCKRVHDRCGTTFMFLVMFVSIFVFTVLGSVFPMINAGALRLIAKLLLLPVIAGISYEILKLLSKTESPLVYPLKLPGLLLQRITTKEPDDDMIEVAITAFNKVLKMDEDINEPTTKFVCAEKLTKLLEEVKSEFKENGIDETDAEWIVSYVSEVKRSDLEDSKKVLQPSLVEKINGYKAERLKGRPLAYVLGNADFYGYEIKTDERALIPRPETEELVERALKSIDKNSKVLDLCTGSGAIALTVKLKTGAEVVASDISDEAISLAEENFAKFGAEISLIKSDMFDSIDDKFDCIISNPPYIKSKDIDGLDGEVKNFEPTLALDGGEDGLKFYREIAENADKHLKEGGKLFLEIGFDEGEAVKELFSGKYETEVYKDISGNDRIVVALKI